MATGTSGSSRRGRVVMLVDNGIDVDSRVQKAARSAAAAGWDVVLLGLTEDGQPRSWRIGDAEARLLPVSTVLQKRRHEFRRHLAVAPLAYPPTGVGANRKQAIAGWRADLTVRRAEARSARGARGQLRRKLLGAQDVGAQLAAKWVGLRGRQLVFAQKARGRLVLPTDRAYTMFWRAVAGDRAWRRLEPGLWSYELAYGPVVDELAPDVIHANDFRMLGVGARAKIRANAAGRDVKLVWDAHEFLPGVQPWRNNARWLPANTAHEREYAPFADAVITVSEDLAELLQRTHRLPARPDVVLNAPDLTEEEADAPDIRALCGVGPATPLLVYSGLGHDKRGLGLMVDALPQLAGVHVAFVINKPDGPYAGTLRAAAKAAGVDDRVHILPYVPHGQVVPFLSGADAGVIPIKHFPNHEIALITKFFEYSHARLPIVVSDVKAMAATVRATGQGEVFTAGDAASYVAAVRAVLADPARYRAAYDKPGVLDAWTWQAQAATLDEVYTRLTADRRS